MEEPNEVYMLRLFTTNMDSNINLNKEQVVKIIQYITKLESYYNYYINLLIQMNDILDKEVE